MKKVEPAIGQSLMRHDVAPRRCILKDVPMELLVEIRNTLKSRGYRASVNIERLLPCNTPAVHINCQTAHEDHTRLAFNIFLDAYEHRYANDLVVYSYKLWLKRYGDTSTHWFVLEPNQDLPHLKIFEPQWIHDFIDKLDRKIEGVKAGNPLDQ